MRILIVNTLYHPYQVGGAEQSVQLLAEGLARRGHRVTVACTSPKDDLETRAVNGVSVHGIPLKNVYWPFDDQKQPALKPVWHVLDSHNPWMRREVDHLLDAEAPDVMHTHNLGGFTTAVWEAAASRDLPLVHTIRDYNLICPRNMFRNGSNCTSQCWSCRPFAWPRRVRSEAVSAVVGISQFILDRHRQYGYFDGVDRQVVIHNPSPLVRSEAGSGEAAAETSEETVDALEQGVTPANCVGRRLRVGFLGRLSPQKGVEDLLDATRSPDDLPVDVKIGGTGADDYVDDLQQTYQDQSHVQFLGFVNPASFFAEIDVLVVPSKWYEPFGRVVVEAYAFGVPVIAARSGGLPEIVEEGRTGLLYDPGNIEALRRHLRALCRSPERLSDFRLNAFQKSNEFAASHHVDRTLRLYKGVVCP